MPDGEHVPVLLHEAAAALAIRPDGVYVDGTFGRGGHSRAILRALGEAGRLIALDRDPSAATEALSILDRRFSFHRKWFSEITDVLDSEGVAVIDGLLLDIGVSSPQIEDAERGFSFRVDGPLDMRMDPTRGVSAAAWIATATELEIKDVIAGYGEERFAQQIARAVVANRASEPITRTRQLAGIVAKAVSGRARGDWTQDPATRTFQGIRIFINRELDELSLALERSLTRLAPGGRLAVIAFHSLEDRLVKHFMRRNSLPFSGDPRLARVAIAERALPRPPLKLVGRAIRASDDEVARNPRARSASLRVSERTDGP